MKSWRKAIVGTQATVGEAIAAIESGSIQVALVLDGESRLLGIVTDGDIRRGLLRGIPLSGLATDVMNRTPVSAPATLSREERLHLMRQKSIKQLPLLDGRRPVDRTSRPSMTCSKHRTIRIRYSSWRAGSANGSAR